MTKSNEIYTTNRTLILANNNFENELLNNINGPCCIKAPEFFQNSPGKYLLYFAHHSGKYIRLAYSDSLFKNWKILDVQICSVDSSLDFHDHVASPEVFIDQKNKDVYLFFHSREIGNRTQRTFLAKSKNGTQFNFEKIKSKLPFYMRFFEFKNSTYAITKGGNLYQNKGDFVSDDWISLGNIDSGKSNEEVMHNEPGSIRHVAIIKYGNEIFVFYTRIGDAPERIYASHLLMVNHLPRLINEIEILRPLYKFEGSECCLEESSSGPSLGFENAVRDPYVFEEEGRYYLFYTIGGESGIAVCEINMQEIQKKLIHS